MASRSPNTGSVGRSRTETDLVELMCSNGSDCSARWNLIGDRIADRRRQNRTSRSNPHSSAAEP
eukprot:1517588-Rhodomonas_salina.1